MKKSLLFILFSLLIIGCNSKPHTVIYTSKQYKNHQAAVKKATQRPYQINGKWYYPKTVHVGDEFTGIASWYGPKFHGRLTSNGETYDMHGFTAAHKTLPMNTLLKVTNLENGKTVNVRINDRGPFVKSRIIDLSFSAGKAVGIDKKGTAKVRIEVTGFAGQNITESVTEHFYIQVGAFSKKSGADIFKQEFASFGYTTKIVQRNGLYKVYITGFRSYEEAKDFRDAKSIRGFIVGE